MEKPVNEEILKRIAQVENGWSVMVKSNKTPFLEIEELPEDVSLVEDNEVKIIDNENVIKTYFTITEHESNNYSSVLADIIKRNVLGYHLEKIGTSEPVDTEGPISYHFCVLTKLDKFLADMLTIVPKRFY